MFEVKIKCLVRRVIKCVLYLYRECKITVKLWSARVSKLRIEINLQYKVVRL